MKGYTVTVGNNLETPEGEYIDYFTEEIHCNTREQAERFADSVHIGDISHLYEDGCIAVAVSVNISENVEK